MASRRGESGALWTVGATILVLITVVIILYITGIIPRTWLPAFSCEGAGGRCAATCSEQEFIHSTWTPKCQETNPEHWCCMPKSARTGSGGGSSGGGSSGGGGGSPGVDETTPLSLAVYYDDPLRAGSKLRDGADLTLEYGHSGEHLLILDVYNTDVAGEEEEGAGEQTGAAHKRAGIDYDLRAVLYPSPNAPSPIAGPVLMQEEQGSAHQASSLEECERDDTKSLTFCKQYHRASSFTRFWISLDKALLSLYDSQTLRLDLLLLAEHGASAYDPGRGDARVSIDIEVKNPIVLRASEPDGLDGWDNEAIFSLYCPSDVGCDTYRYALTGDLCSGLSRSACRERLSEADQRGSLAWEEAKPYAETVEQLIINESMREQYVFVETKDSQGNEYFSLSEAPIKLDTAPPIVTIVYDWNPLEQIVSTRCVDEGGIASGCREEYTYQFIEDLGAFLNAFKNVAGETEGLARYCPDARLPYRNRRTAPDLTYNEPGKVMVICVRYEDKAGNYDVAAEVLFSTQELLATTLERLLE